MSDISQLNGSGGFSEAAIFGRVVEESGELSRELAEHILSLGIAAHDRNRVSELLEKNAVGELTREERDELGNLNHVADILSLWHSRARRVLKPC